MSHGSEILAMQQSIFIYNAGKVLFIMHLAALANQNPAALYKLCFFCVIPQGTFRLTR